MQVVSLLASRYAVTVSFRLLAWPAVVVYAILIYSSAQILVTHASMAPMGVALLATACLQTLLTLLASVLELFR